MTETKNEKTQQAESLEAVFFYNQNESRGVILSKDAIFRLGERALRTSQKTFGSSGPQTLMTLEAGHRFMKGETVTVEDLYNLAEAGLKRFSNLDWDKRLYDVGACSVISSYFYDLFGAFPITMIMGPFESGKTRLLLCIVYMGHRGMPILGPSEASIFRTAEAWKGFLGIDEFWQISKEIERLLRASYKKGMKVPRVDGIKGDVTYLSLFDLFGKVAIASQEPFPPNIVSKGILFQLRKMPDPCPEKRDPEPRDFEEFRAKAYIARLTWVPEVKSCADALDKKDLDVSGRDYEVWKPILTIASMIGGKVWENVLSYAKESCEQKHHESYEELKEVIEAIYRLIEEKNGEFPVSFTPKQIHDEIWERCKDEYRVVKEKQEIEGEQSEKYDYDTRRFEELYRVHKIGGTYLQQLGLKGRRKERGTQYQIHSAEEFHGLVIRYHPDLPSQEPKYANLVLTSKLMPELPEMPAKADSRVERHGSEVGISRPTGNSNASYETNVSPPSSENTLKERITGNTVNTCITSSSLHHHSEMLNPSISEQLQPPFMEAGSCAICRAHGPLRPNLEGKWLICQKCFEEQSERDSARVPPKSLKMGHELHADTAGPHSDPDEPKV